MSLASKHLGEGGMAAGEDVLHGCPTSTRWGEKTEEGDDGRSATLRHIGTEKRKEEKREEDGRVVACLQL